jgi:hypothetical protein
MISPTPLQYQFNNPIPDQVLAEWKNTVRFEYSNDTPPEVKEFIEALAAKLPSAERFRIEKVPFTGYELSLCGIKEIGKEPVVKFGVYQIDVPVLQPVAAALTMYRIYKRKGRPGLIDYCKAKVKGRELERVLDILNVHVFKQERPEFRQVMDAIYNSKQLTDN